MYEYPTYKYKSLTLYIQETFNDVTSPVKIMKNFPIQEKGKRKQFFPQKLCLCKLIRCPNIVFKYCDHLVYSVYSLQIDA